jgi:hypothetical protein
VTLKEARELLESDAYFTVLVPWASIEGDINATITRRLSQSYTPEEFEIVEPMGHEVLYSYARTMARTQAEKQGATFWISNRAASRIMLITPARGKRPARQIECVLRVVRIKDPAPLEPEKFPMKSFDPTAIN